MKPCPESRPTDEVLARRAQAGDLGAFEELVTRYEGAVYGFMQQHIANAEDARDLAQIALVRAYRRLHRFDPERRFRPWLFALARHIMVDHYRKRPTPPPPPDEWEDGRDPRRILEESDQARALWQWVRGQLRPAQHTVFWLRVEEGMTVREIAQIMGRSDTAIKVMLFRIRKRLQHAWKDNHAGASEQAGEAGHGLKGVVL